MLCLPGEELQDGLVRFALAGRVQYGSLQGDRIQPLEGELHALTVVSGAKTIPLGSVKLLTPTAASKVIAIGPGRRRVLGAGATPPERPTLFFKPSTAVTNPEDPIILMRERAQHAIELTVEQELDEVLGAASSARVGAQRACIGRASRPRFEHQFWGERIAMP